MGLGWALREGEGERTRRGCSSDPPPLTGDREREDLPASGECHMSLDQATALLQAHLLGGADFEMAGSDHATRVGYRVTVRHGDVDLAPFSIIPPAPSQTSLTQQTPPH